MNAAFFLGIIFILCMLIGMTIIVSGLKNKIYRLTQVIALLEKRIEGLENKEKNAWRRIGRFSSPEGRAISARHTCVVLLQAGISGGDPG